MAKAFAPKKGKGKKAPAGEMPMAMPGRMAMKGKGMMPVPPKMAAAKGRKKGK